MNPRDARSRWNVGPLRGEATFAYLRRRSGAEKSAPLLLTGSLSRALVEEENVFFVDDSD